MIYDSTGSTFEPAAETTDSGGPWKGHRKTNALQTTSPGVVDGVGVSGDRYTPTLATGGARSTGASTASTVIARHAAAPGVNVPPKLKHACHTLWTNCVENLDRAIDHNEEFFLRCNAIEHVKDALGELWNARADREEQFAEIVNMLQAILAKRSVEDFQPEQLSSIRLAFEKIRAESVYDDEFANTITIELMEGGVDALRELE
jgi:hypothetical protein